jgi:parallel beta-helix repeat protein
MVNSTLVATLYVNPVVGNDSNAGTRLNPYKTLTRALRETTTHNTIIQLVSGTYSTASGEVFPLVIPSGAMVVGHKATKGKGIVISGSGEYQSPSFGSQNVTLLLLGDAQLMGVMIENAAAKGTGVWIESGTSTLAHNTLINCGREGVFVSGSAKPVILDNVFVQNAASGLVIARTSKGEVRRNVFQQNALAIAISDFAAPLVANNTLSQNRLAIALSREARPVLRNNIIEKNTQGGLLINGNAIPDLGTPQESAGNIFRHNQRFDLQNLTSTKVISAGNDLNMKQVKGLVECIAPKQDTHSLTMVNPNNVYVSSFIDLIGHWAEPFIQALVNMNLTRGFADGSYKPDKPMTRAQYAFLVANAFNPSPKHPDPDFIDIPKNFWAYDAIKIAARGGFVSGLSDRTFGHAQNVLRLQVIVSLANGLALNTAHPDILRGYIDYHAIPDSARAAVATATQQRIVVNYPEPRLLQPSREATRGEVAAMVYQALVIIGRTPAIPSPYVVSPLTNKNLG